MRIQIKKNQILEKVQDVVEHVEPIIEKVKDAVENVAPVALEVVEHVAPVILEVVEAFSDAPADVPLVEKQVLRVHNNLDIKETNTRDEEINTIELEDKLMGFEECLLKICPIAKKPITHILGAHLVFNVEDVISHSLNVEHQIVESDDPNAFSLFVKNNGSDDVKIKINYHVLFD